MAATESEYGWKPASIEKAFIQREKILSAMCPSKRTENRMQSIDLMKVETDKTDKTDRTAPVTVSFGWCGHIDDIGALLTNATFERWAIALTARPEDMPMMQLMQDEETARCGYGTATREAHRARQNGGQWSKGNRQTATLAKLSVT